MLGDTDAEGYPRTPRQKRTFSFGLSVPIDSVLLTQTRSDSLQCDRDQRKPQRGQHRQYVRDP